MKKIYYSWLLGYPKQEYQSLVHPWYNDFKKGSAYPKDFFDPISKSLEKYNINYEHFKCPAFQEWNKNMWIVKQPFDLTFYHLKHAKKIIHSQVGDGFKDFFLLHETKEDLYQEAQFAYQILFWTEEKNIWVELYPHPELSRLNLDLVPGTFCISEWTRPVSFGFKILKPDTDITLKKDMPLYYIKFLSKTNYNDNYILENAVPSDKILDKLSKDIALKFYVKNESWKFMKSKAESTEKKTCPFLKLFSK